MEANGDIWIYTNLFLLTLGGAMRPQILHLQAKNRNPPEKPAAFPYFCCTVWADKNPGGWWDGQVERRAHFTPSSLDVQYPVADLPFGPGNSKQMCQPGSEEDPAWLLDLRKRAASHLRASADPDPALR